MQTDTQFGKLDVFASTLFAVKDWVIYDISLRSPGMNQAYLLKLYAANLTNRNNVYITDFHVGGGYQFGLGSKDNVLLFDQSVPNSQNDFTYNISSFDLETGKRSEVPTNEIKMQKEEYIYKGHVFKLSFL